MIVLSLFDGISCARVALGDRVKKYYASEIDKYAIQVAKKNYPDTIHLGDVKTIKKETIAEPIDLLIGGSPCVDLSIAKQNRKGLKGERSGLFWEYARIKRELNPKWFILENVASMAKADRDAISKEMGVEPILIDASLVSAQSRKRLFWTNIPNVTLPTDKGIVLKDILQPDAEVDERFTTKTKKAFCLSATYSKTSTNEKGIAHCADKKKRTMVGLVGNTDSQANRVYSVDGKSATLSANGGGLGAKTGLYAVGCSIRGRKGDKATEYTNQLEERKDGKASALTSCASSKLALVVTAPPPKVRRLTPTECERLQSLPDNYTDGISNSQRYKCLGNAFNVEVIKHILGFMP
jgi:DNA-cytosine methyltransferase